MTDPQDEAQAALSAHDEALKVSAAMLKRALDGIERINWNHVFIDRYPHGACGHCAELLANHLRQRHGIVPVYAYGDFYREDGSWSTSHAWVECDGLILDISGDQFGWPAVIATRSSPWHVRVHDVQRRPWALEVGWWGQQCGGLWRAAEQYMSEHEAERR